MPRRTVAQQAAHEVEATSAATCLREAFDRHGAMVYTIVDHRNRVGDVHWIRAFAIMSGWRHPEIMDVSHLVACILDEPANTRGHRGVVVGGGGMDMAHDLVYRLSRAMYGPEIDGENGGYFIRHQRL